MKYTGPIFRPPLEANTLLLQVTVGCAHNKCTFCTMYRDTKFMTESMEQIEKDLKEAKQMYGSLKRIFLINGDAFVLSPRRLKEISDKIIEYFPQMETISMYASVRNIMAKSDEDLKMLREARINDLWMGIETGNAEILKSINKGFTLEDTYEQLERLNKVGIRHNSIFMLGVAGHGKGIMNAVDTAKLINATKPQLVAYTSLGLFEGSELSEEARQGKFVQETELEILQEERKVIELIELDNAFFFGSHPTNAASINGYLPKDREKMIDVIDNLIENSSDTFLNGSTGRSTL